MAKKQVMATYKTLLVLFPNGFDAVVSLLSLGTI